MSRIDEGSPHAEPYDVPPDPEPTVLPPDHTEAALYEVPIEILHELRDLRAEREALLAVAQAAQALSDHEDADHYTGWFADHDKRQAALRAALGRLNQKPA